jgi:PAS domain S-box-containing protein
MNSLTPFINLPTLEQMMDRSPILVAPNTLLIDAISLMSPASRSEGPHCDRSPPLNQREELFNRSLLVTEHSQLVGIVTERDVLRLIASGIDMSQAKVAQAMTHPVITLTLSPQQNILTAWSLMRQHQIRYLPIINSQGQVVGQLNQSDIFQWVDPVALFQEMHDRQTAEADLRQSEQRFRAIFDSTFQFIGVLTPEGILTEANRTALDAIGASLADVVGKPFWLTPWWIHSPGLQDQLQQAVMQAAKGELVRFEAEHILGDGSSVFVDFSLKPVFDETGTVLMLIPEGRDISDRKQMMESLRESEQRLQTMLDNSTAVIYMKDLQGRYMIINHRYEALFHVNRDEIKGKTDHDIFPKEIADAFQTNDREVIAAGIALESEEVAPQDDGLHTYLTIKFPLFDSEGKIYAVCGMSTDISDRKAAEIELQHQKQDLARSNAELQKFAYVASHDLQEPLRMITSYLELLERRYNGQLDDKADQFIAYAVDGAARMQALINDLLNYSRIRTRGQSFQAIDCTVALNNALRNLQVAITDNNATITYDSLPQVNADATQLTQLFQNLIGNAIKFRSEDPPHIQISAKPTDGNWLFSVRDNGIGIEAQYTERIFVIFQRLHSRMEYPGTGMGLAICKKIVERHGGTLWVESKPNEGSTFYFTLPEAGEPNHEYWRHPKNR